MVTNFTTYLSNGKPLKLVDHVTYLGSNIPFTVSNVNIYIRGVYDKFPDFLRMDTFIDSTHMKI